jgi:hypothetical protein
MVDIPEKVRENRLRRMAARQGLLLTKSRQRDPRAVGYGGWMLLNGHTGNIEVGHPDYNWLSLDEVEKALTEDTP